jgi:hypothetical protein
LEGHGVFRTEPLNPKAERSMIRKAVFYGVLCGVLVLGGASMAFAADQTWSGKISDSKCGATHSSTEHDGKKLSDRQCTAACIKGGAKYVFVSDGKVYNVDNQDFAGLPVHAGHSVKLTGEMTGDTIKVSKIEMPASKMH